MEASTWFKEGAESMQDLLDQYLSVAQVAEILRKRPKTVYRYLAFGLPSRKIGQTHLIRRDELVAWIEARRVGRISPFRRQPPTRRPCSPSRDAPPHEGAHTTSESS